MFLGAEQENLPTDSNSGSLVLFREDDRRHFLRDLGLAEEALRLHLVRVEEDFKRGLPILFYRLKLQEFFEVHTVPSSSKSASRLGSSPRVSIT